MKTNLKVNSYGATAVEVKRNSLFVDLEGGVLVLKKYMVNSIEFECARKTCSCVSLVVVACYADAF